VINTISTFRLALPTFFSQVTDNVGNPVKAMSYSMDCFLTTITNIEILYFRMIWSLLMPFFYLVAFLVGYAILILLKKTKYSTSVVYTTFIYMFIYLQPTMIGGFMQLASLRTISDISWVQSDVAYQYYTVSHQTWVLHLQTSLDHLFCYAHAHYLGSLAARWFLFEGLLEPIEVERYRCPFQVGLLLQ
jgi:hypothetical protein